MTRPAWRDATSPRRIERGAAGVERDCLQPGESRAAGRRLALPKRIENWSLTSLQQRLVKAGGRVVPPCGMRATIGCCCWRRDI
jgi:hypothetical protein